MAPDIPRHTYDAIFDNGELMEGRVACPECSGSMIHPTGHSRPINSDEEYGPRVGVIGSCECGQVVEIRLGNYKGHLGIDVQKPGW